MTHGPDHNLLPLGVTLDRVDDAVGANPGRPSAPESAEQRRSDGSRFHAYPVDRVSDRLPYRGGQFANVILSTPSENEVRQALARA